MKKSHELMVLEAELNPNTDDQDLIKAMSKEGLVQREVQVRAKGKTFMRKQWVRAGEVEKEADKPNSKMNKEVSKGKITTKSSGFNTYAVFVDDKKVGEVAKTYKKGYEYWKVVGTKETHSTRKAAISALGEGLKSDANESKIKGDNKPAPSFDYNHFSALMSDKTRAMVYLKESGITWKEDKHPGINWMRASMAAKKADALQLEKKGVEPKKEGVSPELEQTDLEQQPDRESSLRRVVKDKVSEDATQDKTTQEPHKQSKYYKLSVPELEAEVQKRGLYSEQDLDKVRMASDTGENLVKEYVEALERNDKGETGMKQQLESQDEKRRNQPKPFNPEVKQKFYIFNPRKETFRAVTASPLDLGHGFEAFVYTSPYGKTEVFLGKTGEILVRDYETEAGRGYGGKTHAEIALERMGEVVKHRGVEWLNSTINTTVSNFGLSPRYSADGNVKPEMLKQIAPKSSLPKVHKFYIKRKEGYVEVEGQKVIVHPKLTTFYRVDETGKSTITEATTGTLISYGSTKGEVVAKAQELVAQKGIEEVQKLLQSYYDRGIKSPYEKGGK